MLTVSSPVSYEGENIVVEGKPFEIICRLSVFHFVKWLRDQVTLYPDENTKIELEEDKTKPNYIMSKLRVAHARDYHSGEYRCSPFVDLSHSIIVLGGKESQCCVEVLSTKKSAYFFFNYHCRIFFSQQKYHVLD